MLLIFFFHLRNNFSNFLLIFFSHNFSIQGKLFLLLLTSIFLSVILFSTKPNFYEVYY